jgi:hypothetical protein
MQRSVANGGAALLLWIAASALVPRQAAADEPTTASLISEVRQTFTLAGERIPPEIYRDFGEGDLTDNRPIWVTVVTTVLRARRSDRGNSARHLP